jgi:hypothetical protein
MTPQQIDAMKLALEALQWCHGGEPCGTSEAITAIEEVLAEHAMRNVQRLGQEIEQEPVAHCKVRPLRGDESFPKVEIDWVNQPVPGPLYTSPPQRKPLTDEEIDAIADEYLVDYRIPAGCALNFARDIEAAHGIKENT